MEIKNNVKVETETNASYVIGPGGVRMTYKEWREMRENELF